MKLDLHNHTNQSKDANIYPETFLRTAQQLGIGVAITDHSSIQAWDSLKLHNKTYKIPLVLGEEVMTKNEEGKRTGEIIGLFMNTFVKDGTPGEVIDALRDQDALITVPHPFDTFRNNLKELELYYKKVDCVEVFNARSYTAGANEKALAFAKEKGLGMTAGSDGHTVKELGHAYVQNDECDTVEEMRKAILKGKVKIVGKRSGPMPHIKTQLIKANILKDE